MEILDLIDTVRVFKVAKIFIRIIIGWDAFASQHDAKGLSIRGDFTKVLNKLGYVHFYGIAPVGHLETDMQDMFEFLQGV